MAFRAGHLAALTGVAAGLLAGAPATAAPIALDLGGGEAAFASRITQIILLVTAISLAPAIVVATTAFIRVVVTLSILRAAMGLHQTPPNMVIVSLALFLTAFVMAPTFDRAWREGVRPLMDQSVEVDQGVAATVAPLREFMATHVKPGHLTAFERLIAAHEETGVVPEDGAGGPFTSLAAPPDNQPNRNIAPNAPAAAEAPLRALVPAFIVSELSRAFEIGFLLFLPFLVIDLVVAAVLMSMGMMMLPPAVVSLPFKLIFFVLIDGWRLVSEGLALSFLT